MMSIKLIVCHYYLLSDLMEKAKEVGSEMASKTATAATKFAAKAKASWNKGLEQSKQKMNENTQKSSFFSKALRWTQELTKDITEEYQRSEAADRAKKPASVKEVPVEESSDDTSTEAILNEEAALDQPQKDVTVASNPPTEESSQPASQPSSQSTSQPATQSSSQPTSQPMSQPSSQPTSDDPPQSHTDTSFTNLETLNVDDIVKLPSLRDNPTCTWFVLTEVKTSTGIIGGDNYSIALQGQVIALVKKLGSTNCVIMDIWKLSSLDKMTKKKDDPNIVTLSFENGTQGILWRIHLEQSLELCTAITAILSSMD